MKKYIREFEQYILSNGDAEVMANVAPGTQQDNIFSYLRIMKEVETAGRVTEEQQDELNQLFNAVEDKYSRKMKLRSILRMYDLPTTTPELKSDLIKQIHLLYFPNIHFEYPRPAYVKKEIIDNVFTSTTQNTLASDDLEISKWIEQNIYKSNNTNNLELIDSAILLNFVDFNKLKEDHFNKILFGLQVPFYKLNDSQLEIIANYIETYTNKIRSSVYLLGFLNSLTVDQLEKFINVVKNDYIDKNEIISIIIQKKFNKKLENASNEHNKREVLLEIYQNVKGLPSKYNSYKAEVLLEILNNGRKLEIYDLNILLEYLDNPINIDPHIWKSYNVSTSNRYMIGNLGYQSSEQDIILAYLNYFFIHQNMEMEKFADYLEFNYLRNIYYTCLVMKGEENEELINFLGISKYEEITKKVSIEICKHNKSNFAIEDDVSLEVEIKNVQTLFIKVFFINTENYYLEEKKTLQSDIKLEGLIASSEQTYTFNDKPQTVVRRKFNLDSIPKQRGLYIVEIIGNGICSRAIIKKGQLTLVSRPTPLGLMVFILNEKNEICKDNTSLWFKGDKYNAEKTGSIMIPYSSNTRSDSAVIMHDGFAEITNISVPSESYHLNGFMHLNHESIIMGATCKLLIHPQLTINGRLANRDLLKNPKVKIVMNKLENGANIPIHSNDDNIKITPGKDIVVDLNIPHRVTSIQCTFEAEVFSNSEKKNLNLQFTHMFNVNNEREVNSLTRLYLTRKTNGEYIVEALDINGEPENDISLQVTCEHKYIRAPFNFNLTTDKNGQINLGKLDLIKQITITCNYQNYYLAEVFQIEHSPKITYPQSIDILDSESIELPIFEKEIRQISLFDVNFSQTFNNNIQIEDISNGKQLLKIANLPTGSYTLQISPNKIITVNVHTGSHWHTKNYIITEKIIKENSQDPEPIFIQDIKFTDNNLEIKLKNLGAQPRLSLYATNFIPQSTLFFQNFQKHNSLLSLSSESYFTQWENQYLSNNKLHEEIQYVLDRKHYERYLGISLEKPSLLVKRQYIRDTNTSTQIVNEGDYKNMLANEKCFERAMGMDPRFMLRNQESASISRAYEFLVNPALALLNIQPNNDGVIVIKNFPFSLYKHLHLVAYNTSSCSEELITYSDSLTEKRNLALSKPLDSNKAFTEKKLINLVSKGEAFVIKDITTTNYIVIDCLDKLLSYKLLKSPSLSEQWKEFKFLFELDKLDEKAINKNISKMFGHEINVFLYFKYPSLFNSLVLPIIKMKCEKSFLDHLFLDNIEVLKEHLNPIKLVKLNPLEVCLLIHKLKESNRSECENLIKILEENSKKLEVKGQNYDNLFNTFMNMKSDQVDIGENQNYSLHQPSISTSNLNTMNMNTMNMNRFSNCFQQESARMYQQNDLSYGEDEDMECEQIQYYNKNSDLFDTNLGYYNQISLHVPKPTIFQNAGLSKEYQETHYFNKSLNDYPNTFNFTPFWVTLAKHLFTKGLTGFISQYVYEINNDISSLVFTLAVLDLPYSVQTHEFNRKDLDLEITAASNAIIFTKQIGEVEYNPGNLIILEQNITEAKQDPDKDEVLEEFIAKRVYTHETIITNISNKQLNIELLIQIPAGAIPVYGSDYALIQNKSIERFKTINVRIHFFFPQIGTFTQYPPSISLEGNVIKKGKCLVYDVKIEKSIFKGVHLDNILEGGSKEDILNYLKSQEYIKHHDISKIYWLLKDKSFYDSLINLLKSKFIYNETVWGFSIYHNDESNIKEFFENANRLRNDVGHDYSSSLLQLNNTNNFDILNHLDYHPIINARVHSLGKDSNKILNKELKETYEDFITQLVISGRLSGRDWLRLTYYLILQERLDEALITFKRIKLDEIVNSELNYQIQYDYINCYLDFCFGYPDFKVAKSLCTKYKKFGLDQWKEYFEEIEDQLIEFSGNVVDDSLLEEKKNKKKKGHHSESKLSFTVHDSTLSIVHSGHDEIHIKLYLIDLEVLFSRKPFISQNNDDYSFIQPNFVDIIRLEKKTTDSMVQYNLPSNYITRNLFIELSAGSNKAFHTYFNSSLNVVISESLGEIKVTTKDLKPIDKVYVKAFSRSTSGEEKFYKDGYTDLRGTFNYLTLNTNQIKTIEKFSILVIHDELGSCIKEARPPANINTGESEYDNLVQLRQQVKQEWRTKNKK